MEKNVKIVLFFWKERMPYPDFTLPYAKFTLPPAKFTLPSAKFTLPSAKFTLPSAKIVCIGLGSGTVSFFYHSLQVYCNWAKVILYLLPKLKKIVPPFKENFCHLANKFRCPILGPISKKGYWWTFLLLLLAFNLLH